MTTFLILLILGACGFILFIMFYPHCKGWHNQLQEWRREQEARRALNHQNNNNTDYPTPRRFRKSRTSKIKSERTATRLYAADDENTKNNNAFDSKNRNKLRENPSMISFRIDEDDDVINCVQHENGREEVETCSAPFTPASDFALSPIPSIRTPIVSSAKNNNSGIILSSNRIVYSCPRKLPRTSTNRYIHDINRDSSNTGYKASITTSIHNNFSSNTTSSAGNYVSPATVKTTSTIISTDKSMSPSWDDSGLGEGDNATQSMLTYCKSRRVRLFMDDVPSSVSTPKSTTRISSKIEHSRKLRPNEENESRNSCSNIYKVMGTPNYYKENRVNERNSEYIGPCHSQRNSSITSIRKSKDQQASRNEVAQRPVTSPKIQFASQKVIKDTYAPSNIHRSPGIMAAETTGCANNGRQKIVHPGRSVSRAPLVKNDEVFL